MNWKYVKKLNKEDLVLRFLNSKGVKLPTEVIKMLEMYNGGRPPKKCFDTNKHKECVFKTLLSYNTDDLETIYKIYKEGSDTKFIEMKLYPIASDPFGNYICVDLKDGEAIVLLRMETLDVEQCADNITEFINKLY